MIRRLAVLLLAGCSGSAPLKELPDLASGCRPSALSFSASAAVSFPSMTGPAYLVAADFDGDGNLDFAVSNYKVSTVSVLLGNGDGTFAAPEAYLVGAAAGRDVQGLGVGDFTGDGVLDLVAVNTTSATLTVLRGTGGGHFVALANPQATGPMPEGLITADFNRDGKLDVALALGDGSLDLLLGDGQGGFSLAPVATPLAAAADFNGDGIPDLAGGAFSTLDMATARSAQIVLGKGDGSFTLPGASYTVGSGPDGMAAGDFDGDRRLDLVVDSFYDGAATILLGNGDGTFSVGQTLTAGKDPVGLAVGDLDCQGQLDLVVANGGDGSVSVFRGNGDGSFAPALAITAGGDPGATVIGDFNGDGRADILCANYEGDTVTLLTQAP